MQKEQQNTLLLIGGNSDTLNAPVFGSIAICYGLNSSLRHRVQTGSEVHTASCPVGTKGLFPWG